MTFKKIFTNKGNFREISEKLGTPYPLEERWWDFCDLLDDLWFKIMPLYWLYRLPHVVFQDWPREVKWAWQRVFKGHDERVNWSVNYYLGPIILESLKNFKASDRHGYPGHGDADTPEKWEKILDDMIEGWDYMVSCDDNSDKICEEFGDERVKGETFMGFEMDGKKWNERCTKEMDKRTQEAQDKASLFIKHFWGLWD